MIADGFFADKELVRNLFGRLILYQQFKYFPFPVGQQRFPTLIARQMCHPSLLGLLEHEGKGLSQVIL